MTSTTKRAVTALLFCALADLAAGPAIFAAAEPEEALKVLAFAVPALGIFTAIAAAGLAGGRAWAVPVALVTRSIDVVGALPAFGAGPGPTAAAITVIVLSGVAVVLVLHLRRATVLRRDVVGAGHRLAANRRDPESSTCDFE